MTSQIVSETIDETFPIAGQDNDSQGFRDNFSVVKTGLATAQSEITVLQETTAKVSDANNDPVTNNFLGSVIENARINKAYGTSYALTSASTITLDFESGEYQYVNLVGNPATVTFDIESLPTVVDSVSKLTLEISQTITGTTDINFNVPGSISIKYGWVGQLQMTSTSGTKIFEIISRIGNVATDLTIFISLKGEFA